MPKRRYKQWVTIVCRTCKKEFEITPCMAKKKYCSRECQLNGAPQRRYKQRVTIVCHGCKKEFEVKPSKVNRKYCSRECQLNRAPKRRNKQWVTLICHTCKKAFEVKPCLANKKYCSKECYSNRATKICVICGKPFNPRDKERLQQTRIPYCSDACYEMQLSNTDRNKKKREHGRELSEIHDMMVEKGIKFICQRCGKEFVPKTKGRITYCSRLCSDAARGDRKQHRLANGLTTECERKQQASRKPITIRACPICGKDFESRNTAKYCLSCRGKYRNMCDYVARMWKRMLICTVCGTEYEKNYGISNGSRCYCSEECKRAAKREQQIRGKYKREAKIRCATIERVYRKKVYERDGYRCGLCGKLCDGSKTVPHPWAPTIDHIIPISLGGEHSYANVRTAHFICNSKRCNKMSPNGEQQWLIG